MITIKLERNWGLSKPFPLSHLKKEYQCRMFYSRSCVRCPFGGHPFYVCLMNEYKRLFFETVARGTSCAKDNTRATCWKQCPRAKWTHARTALLDTDFIRFAARQLFSSFFSLFFFYKRGRQREGGREGKKEKAVQRYLNNERRIRTDLSI